MRKLTSNKEFAAIVRGDHPDAQSFRRYVLAELRCARQRARLMVKEIETIGVALAHDLIPAETALEWLAEADALEFLMPTEPPWERLDEDGKDGHHDCA